jgi:3-hydroxyisobutyrate dehydrogenase
MIKVAFIGTGKMGSKMAMRILDAGYDLVVCNRSSQKASELINAGAEFIETPAAAVEDVDFIFSMVGDNDDSRDVWTGSHGVIHGKFNNEAIAVECSTLSHTWILELNEKLQAAGLRFSDCPVTGGPDGANAGTLKVLAGADSDTLEILRPVLSSFAQEIIHFGPVGSGMSYKLIVNLMGAVQAVALAEGLLLAEKCGLDLEQVGYALSQGTIASPHVKYLIERMMGGNHEDVYFSTRWRCKDAAYALELAAEQFLDLPTSVKARDIYQLAVARGKGDKNSSIIFEVIRELSHGK